MAALLVRDLVSAGFVMRAMIAFMGLTTKKNTAAAVARKVIASVMKAP